MFHNRLLYWRWINGFYYVVCDIHSYNLNSRYKFYIYRAVFWMTLSRNVKDIFYMVKTNDMNSQIESFMKFYKLTVFTWENIVQNSK